MLNQLNDQQLAMPIQPLRGTAGVAWRCDDCRVWWGSQNSRKPTTQFLLRLPEDVAQSLPWDEYRGWQLRVERAGTCPECSQPTGRVVYAQA
ncbi:hypothetical protein TFLX_01155 [Thermoflexales bacterium]|jgi:hypothetical protein|nr:hypothetical protein TFLX_01155 [Thermoflexales bacterium]